MKIVEYVNNTIDQRIWEKTMKFCQEKFNILHTHIINIRITKRANGHRFDDEKLHQFFILISFYGRSLIELMKRAFAFPCWRTIMNWKKDRLEEYNIKLNGSVDSLSQLKEKFYGTEMDDNRAVVAIDAVLVWPTHYCKDQWTCFRFNRYRFLTCRRSNQNSEFTRKVCSFYRTEY